jgi:hypothetical protein
LEVQLLDEVSLVRSNELGVLFWRQLCHLLLELSHDLFLVFGQVRDRAPAGKPDNPWSGRLSHFRLSCWLNLLTVTDWLDGLPGNAGGYNRLGLLRLLEKKFKPE